MSSCWRPTLVAVVAVVLLSVACTSPNEIACAPNDVQYCECADRTRGYSACASDGTGYGACDCSGQLPAGAFPADAMVTDAGEADGAERSRFGEGCDDDAFCGVGLECYAFNAKGKRCSKPCTSDSDCPVPPGLGCSNKGECKVP